MEINLNKRHTNTPAKLLLATQLSSSRTMLNMLHNNQKGLKVIQRTSTDQQITSAAQSALCFGRQEVFNLEQKVKSLHKTLKTFDKRTFPEIFPPKKETAEDLSLKERIQKVNLALSKFKLQLKELCVTQKDLKKAIKTQKQESHSITRLTMNENCKKIQLHSQTILILKQKYKKLTQIEFNQK